LADERFADAVRVVSESAKHQRDGCVANLRRELFEMSDGFWGQLDLVHRRQLAR
jgi:hypothetical protein